MTDPINAMMGIVHLGKIKIFSVILSNKILRRIFGPKNEENGEWRRLHNEELDSLYRSPNIVNVIKSRRLRWADHVPRRKVGVLSKC